jgi:hypothetical protein
MVTKRLAPALAMHCTKSISQVSQQRTAYTMAPNLPKKLKTPCSPAHCEPSHQWNPKLQPVGGILYYKYETWKN